MDVIYYKITGYMGQILGTKDSVTNNKRRPNERRLLINKVIITWLGRRDLNLFVLKESANEPLV
jgi:hypothetical protein